MASSPWQLEMAIPGELTLQKRPKLQCSLPTAPAPWPTGNSSQNTGRTCVLQGRGWMSSEGRQPACFTLKVPLLNFTSPERGLRSGARPSSTWLQGLLGAGTEHFVPRRCWLMRPRGAGGRCPQASSSTVMEAGKPCPGFCISSGPVIQVPVTTSAHDPRNTRLTPEN